MTIKLSQTDGACGVVVHGVDFSKPVDPATIAELREVWLRKHILVLPDQKLEPADFERFAEYFGAIGDDPYIAPVPGQQRIAAIERRADETGKVFADSWHSDWSFMTTPPAGTCLYGIVIPPHGGDTFFADEHLALAALPKALRAKIEGKIGLHSAKAAYATDGKYADDKFDGAMRIVTSDDAGAVQGHPLIRAHPETGELGLFVGSYVFAIEGMDAAESAETVAELREWVGRPEFHYQHKWEAGTIVLWDNRSVLHKASGGFEGHHRLLHRLTISDDRRRYLQ